MLKRKAPLKRSTKIDPSHPMADRAKALSGSHPMKRRKPIPRKRAKPRRGPLRDPGYRAFLREEGWCPVCWPDLWARESAEIRNFQGCSCDPCHTENGGLSMKGPDSSCAPLCRYHHLMYDSGRKAFEKWFGIDMKAVAKAWWDLYQRRKS